jgi:hypothetical protein
MTIALNNERLTKKQVCSILQIGYSTLGRWMRDGKIKFTRERAESFESAVFFRRADLAEFLPSIPDTHPTASVPESPAQPTAPAPASPRPESRDIRTWAEKYKDGDAADSCGNTIDGANALWPQTGATLVGPVVRVEPGALDSCAHMDHRLLGGHDSATGAKIEAPPVATLGCTRGGEPLAPGMTQEKYDAMMQDWRRRGGGLSEQELAVKLSKAVINRSFPGAKL